jgi:subtilase-type serine protease
MINILKVINLFTKQILNSNEFDMKKSYPIIVTALSTLIITGCAGGGGGSGASSRTLTYTSPSAFESTEYNQQAGLAIVKASSMYYNGHYRWYAQNGGTGGNPSDSTAGTGVNIKVAVVDSGINSSEASTGSQISIDSTNSYDYVRSSSGSGSDGTGHGTHVAGIIAAPRNSSGMHGIAYNATILNLRIFDNSGNSTATDAQIGNTATRAYAAGAMIINNSWGYTNSPITSYTLNAPQTISSYRNYVANGGVIVFSAGNDGQAQVSLMAGLPYRFSGLESGWLAVMAVNQNGNETAYTNRCGVAAAWCIAAPGGGDNQSTEGVYSMYNNGSYTRLSGTSMAAPMVSGAIAGLKSMFPNLSYQQVRDRLLTTANRTGQYANSSIFGQGLMDLDAASSPVGGLSLPTSLSDRGTVASYTGTKISLPEGALLNKLKASYILALDNYQRAPFFVSVENFVQAKKANDNFSERHLLDLKNQSESIFNTNDRYSSTYVPGLNSAIALNLGSHKFGVSSGTMSETSLARVVDVSYVPHYASGDYSSNAFGSSFKFDSNQIAMLISVPNKQNLSLNENISYQSLNGMGTRNTFSLVAEQKDENAAYGFIYSHASDFQRPLGISSSGAFGLDGSKISTQGAFYKKAWDNLGLSLKGSAEYANLSAKSSGLLSFEGGQSLIYKASADKAINKDTSIHLNIQYEKATQGNSYINIPTSINENGHIGYTSHGVGLGELIDSSKFGFNLNHKIDKYKTIRAGVLYERKPTGLDNTGAAIMLRINH